MLKTQARKAFFEKRKNTTPTQQQLWDDLILIQFKQLQLPYVQVLFTYAAMNTEVHTDTIVDYLLFKNPAMQVAYPICNFSDYTMQAHQAEIDTPFVTNKFGTLEPQNGHIITPQSIDVVIVPLLCFDQQGYRVGYGKGFYDKYLALIREDAIKVGLSYYEPIDRIEDSNNFDVPLSYCVTPQKTYEF